MKTLFRFASVLAVIGLLVPALVSCSKGANSIATSRSKLFQSPPEVKSSWESVVSAVNSNGYATALFAIQKMRLHPDLNAEQKQALDQIATAVSDQMHEAANKGDANAQKSIEAWRQSYTR